MAFGARISSHIAGEHSMHSNASSPTFHFGPSWSLANVSIGAAPFFVVSLWLFMTITAPHAYGQQSVPPTARQAATMPEFAEKLGRSAQPVSPQTAPRAVQPGQSRASYQNPMGTRRWRANGGPLDDNTLYTNGAINGTTDAWEVNFGFVVSDSFTVDSGGGTANGLSFGAWLFPGDVLQTVEVQITSAEFGGTTYTDQVVSFTQSGCSGNQYGFNVCTATGSFSPVNLAAGTYWLNLSNAVVNDGDPVFWDENSGPSMASENTVGTIPSEAFTILGSTTTTTTVPPPPPCFQSGIIHDFEGDGSPSGVTLDEHGNLYGTTPYGGDNDNGLAYKLSRTVNNWLYAVLYSFTDSNDGTQPGGVIVGPDGALYGTANGGLQSCNGFSYCGVVYLLRPSPVACPAVFCGWNEEVLYRFAGPPDGVYPNGNLVFDQAGNLYGTTGAGGAYGLGAVYELSPSNGGWTEQVIFSFGPDTTGGYVPNSLLMGRDGNLYGTTSYGGAYYCTYNNCGVVFQLVRSGGEWTERVLHSFEGSQNDGASPQNLVQDSSGNLYGISNYGFSGDAGGVEFMLSSSNGNWTFTELIVRFFEGYTTTFTGLTIDAKGDTSVAGSTIAYYLPDCALQGLYFCDWFVLGRNGVDYSDTFFNAYGLTTDPGGKDLYGVTADCGRYGRGTVWQRGP
jgi:uncharacterized repeat protein (TIGR03803 family)